MILPVIFKPAAAAEVKEAHDWYQKRGTELGNDFLNCVDSCVEFIQRHPLACSIIYKNLRMALVRRFPYLIFYALEERQITVFSVFHTSRNPKIWRRRV